MDTVTEITAGTAVFFAGIALTVLSFVLLLVNGAGAPSRKKKMDARMREKY
ncbi:MAG: hypothetical protein IKI35_00310 [Stomatobaculum sp.]|nr:hypothetical protein [Stomatobaculum sp.]MBR7057148.1 hypothetical protein [Stomatobaculum sp.]